MENTQELKVIKLCGHATIPTRGTDGAVGYDIYSSEDKTINANSYSLVSTGIAIKCPTGTYARIASRSSLSFKNGICIGGGVVDPDYRGEIKVIIFNHSNVEFKIEKGFRIAQFILEECRVVPIKEVQALDETTRGDKGFGSTG